MVAFKVDTFGGMVPAVSDELLPASAAALSRDTFLYSGKLVGLPSTKELHATISPSAAKVYRLPGSYTRSSYLFGSQWLEFDNFDTDVIRAPVFGDTFDRYYWASTSQTPKYNTRARIEAGDPEWLLGINPPAAAPALVVVGGSVKTTAVRVATTIAGTLATSFENGDTVAGVTLVTGDRILIKNQASQLENGIRVVAASGAPTRAADMDASGEFVGVYCEVLEGANAGTFWKCTNGSAPTVDTTAITFAQVTDVPLIESRAYVVTWVSAYSEESAPSPPVVVTGVSDGSWNLSSIPVASADDRGTDRNLTHTRIYRTVTSSTGVATFFLVAEILCTVATYNDVLTDAVVSSNEQLASFAWTPPPSDLEGITMMPNGIVAGFRDNELWFSEPYRPHAWPVSYVQTLEYPIVGLGVTNQTLVACTTGFPVMAIGSTPESISTAKLAAFEPCTSRGSILSSADGVFFVSPNGLILVGPAGAVNITKDLITRDKWKEFAGEARLRAAWFGAAYYAFGALSPGVFEPTAWDPGWVSLEDTTGAHNGILIDPTNTRVAFNTLTSEDLVHGVQNDPWSGEVFVLRGGFVNWLDMLDLEAAPMPALWRSKQIQATDKKNLGAMKVYFKPTPALPVLNPVRNTNLVQTLASDQWGLVRLYADGTLVMTRELRTSGELWKLPSGFKADFWQFEIETRVKIVSIQGASTTKELMTV